MGKVINFEKFYQQLQNQARSEGRTLELYNPILDRKIKKRRFVAIGAALVTLSGLVLLLSQSLPRDSGNTDEDLCKQFLEEKISTPNKYVQEQTEYYCTVVSQVDPITGNVYKKAIEPY